MLDSKRVVFSGAGQSAVGRKLERSAIDLTLDASMEAIAHGDAKSSKVVGRKISEIKLPLGVTIGALVRGEDVLIAHDDVIVASDDHVILFMVDKTQVKAVERLFQVGLTFF